MIYYINYYFFYFKFILENFSIIFYKIKFNIYDNEFFLIKNNI